ncbi:MAG: hypothetical protein V8Q76_10790 [Bacteroides intestinalis]
MKAFSTVVKKTLKLDVLVLFLILLFVSVRGIFGGELSWLNRAISLFIDGYIVSAFIIVLFKKYFKDKNLADILYFNSMIAAIISFVCLLNPNFNDFVRSNFSSINQDFNFLAFRGYGLSAGLTFDYGMIQGLALSYCLFQKSKKSLLLIPLFLVSILFNARTGIVIPALVLFYLLFIRLKIRYWMLAGILYVAFMFIITTDFFYENLRTFMWLEKGFEEITDSSNSATFDTLDKMVIWPSSIEGWIWGTGEDLFNDRYGRNSDIGYILQLNYGGLLLCFFILSWLLVILFRVKKYANKQYFIVVFFVVFAIVLGNYKGDIFSSNILTRVLLLLYVYSVYGSCIYMKRSLISSTIVHT